ncbi:MAG: hypothetical protein L6Q76_26520 [Polyangiaceae bacterium]|nr:hypothetical protein [Polyangiaceae bacterium]
MGRGIFGRVEGGAGLVAGGLDVGKVGRGTVVAGAEGVGGAAVVAGGFGVVVGGVGVLGVVDAGFTGAGDAAAGGSAAGVGSAGGGGSAAGGGSDATVTAGGGSIGAALVPSSAELDRLRRRKNVVVSAPISANAPTPMRANGGPPDLLWRGVATGGGGGANADGPT